ncbi:endonuclease/exonuclease/phosphatase family protein [Glutamicibacter sp.]|uniref:endonuclease/exonuclease/phosphatase family protein n=1 Tax=Glutamicibacter sp. TaxID=1931995 RepID=UPI0028BD8318|nr:endonuclease/exonuclease/phosphatase family protein [Glutamicibacter sp.]
MHKILVGTLSLGLGAALLLPATSASATPTGLDEGAGAQALPLSETSLRVATISTNLTAPNSEELYGQLLGGGNIEATRVADAISAVNPDVVVITGMDAEAKAVAAFQAEYLTSPEDQRSDISYPYSYLAVGSKGLQSGADLDDDRVVGGPGDAWGQGAFAEQGSVVVLSKYPIQQDDVASVTELKWGEVKGGKLQEAQLGGALAASIPVMNNGLWDIPIEYRSERVHILAAQTEPANSSQDFSTLRQHDELKVVSDYISGAHYLRTDQGAAAKGLKGKNFILAGALAQPEGSATQVDPLAKKLGSQDPINSAGNYLMPSQNWNLLGQGRVGDDAPASFQPMTGAAPDAIEASELIWSDIQY